MKNINYITLFALVISLSACLKTDFEELKTVNGTANFTNYIAVGNSLTQGYQDGGLHNEFNQQDNSYPAIIAKQMGVNFTQPLVNGNGSGYLKLLSLTPDITKINADGAWNNGNPSAGDRGGWSSWDKTKKYNNLGVAGILLRNCVSGGTAYIPATYFNPYGAFLDFGPNPASPKTYLDIVKESNATFFTCWLGNNDVLGWSTVGGNDNGGTTILTPVTEFASKYDSILDAFKTMGAKGVCATLPDVTAIPFFTTVPYNPIPMDQTTADQVNSGYASYNGGLDSYVTAGLITASEAAKRKVHFTNSSTNPIIIEDESLTTLPGMPKYRPATANDFILLSASSSIGKAFSATQIYGVSVPFADSLVLTETEVVEVRNHTVQLNDKIKSSANNHGFAVADMYEYMFTLQSGLTFDGVTYSAKFIEGGAFSLDGVHPNSRGYAIIANKFISVINANYGSNIKPVSVQDYRGIIFP